MIFIKKNLHIADFGTCSLSKLFDTQVARRGRQVPSQPKSVLFHGLQTRGHEMVEANHPC